VIIHEEAKAWNGASAAADVACCGSAAACFSKARHNASAFDGSFGDDAVIVARSFR
jgi:hypothetical protein